MRTALVLLACVLAAPLAQAQFADDLFFFGRRAPGVGARLMGLGGAATGGLGDWAASYANPAGLVYLDRTQVLASGHAFAQETQSAGGFVVRPDETLTLGAVAYATALPTLQGAAAVGAGYHETAAYARSTALRDGRATESGWQGELSVAGALALSPTVAVGASLNAPAGQYELRANSFRDDLGGDRLLDAELRGLNVRGGLTARVGGGLRVGLMVETPTVYDVDETRTAADGDGIVSRDYQIRTPWRVAAGLLAGGPGVFVTADLELVDWRFARFLENDADLAFENDVARDLFRPVVNSRIGAEGVLGPVALRAGAAFQPDPRFERPIPRHVRETYAFGLGVRVHRQARLDLAFAHTRSGDDFLLDPADATVLAETRDYRNALQFGLDIRF